MRIILELQSENVVRSFKANGLLFGEKGYSGVDGLSIIGLLFRSTFIDFIFESWVGDLELLSNALKSNIGREFVAENDSVADRTFALFPEKGLDAAVAEGVATRKGDGLAENRHADRTGDVFCEFSIHYK